MEIKADKGALVINALLEAAFQTDTSGKDFAIFIRNDPNITVFMGRFSRITHRYKRIYNFPLNLVVC